MREIAAAHISREVTVCKLDRWHYFQDRMRQLFWKPYNVKITGGRKLVRVSAIYMFLLVDMAAGASLIEKWQNNILCATVVLVCMLILYKTKKRIQVLLFFLFARGRGPWVSLKNKAGK